MLAGVSDQLLHRL